MSFSRVLTDREVQGVPAPFIIDAHTHIDQHDPSETSGVVQRARAAGVGLIVTAGVTVESSRRCVELAHIYPEVLASVGVHPMDMTRPLGEEERLALGEMARDPRVVAISETGLDHMEGMPDREWQEESFRAHIRLAREVGKPVIFHNREAGLAPLRVLWEEGAQEVGAVAHYFQGSAEYARSCLDQGVYLSLAKPLLRLADLQEVVRRLAPLERIVLETDSYPQPFKWKRESWTEPKDALAIAQRVAELKGVPVEEVIRTTFETTVRLLGLGPLLRGR